jgi:hypothetical protein
MRNMNGLQIAGSLAFLAATTLLNVPVFAQTDISGEWASLRNFEEGVEEPIGDYSGLPLNDAARLRADTWEASILTLPERQCEPHGVDRTDNVGPIRIWKEVDPDTLQLRAYHLLVAWMNMHRVIYMDGRPHPPENALHTFMGFSTGQWDGNTLAVTTTHMREQWLRRNGVPRSDRATLHERFVRHGNVLSWAFVVDDPVYLTEPYVRSRQFKFEPGQPNFPYYPCDSVEEVVRPAGVVPNHLPGTNPDLAEYANQYGLPPEVERGGAETMYPEYKLKLDKMIEKAKLAAAGKSSTSK